MSGADHAPPKSVQRMPTLKLVVPAATTKSGTLEEANGDSQELKRLAHAHNSIHWARPLSPRRG
jgi:hypothetical protein